MTPRKERSFQGAIFVLFKFKDVAKTSIYSWRTLLNIPSPIGYPMQAKKFANHLWFDLE
jgi:hypothetical protein